jgi:FkbM family methyltransferase
MTKSYVRRKLVFNLIRAVTNIFSGKGFGLGKIPGAMKVHIFLFNQLLPVETVLIQVQGSKMYVNPHSGVGVNLLRSKVHEPNLTRLFKQAIEEGTVVVDVGAHIGYYTLIASKLVGTKGKVYAFEPEPSNYRLLIRNIHENRYKNVIATQKAVANKEQKEALFLNKKDFGSHSLSRNNVPELGNSLEVESTTLDRFFEKDVGNFKVDFVKMDAQGAEGLIVEGMSKIIEKNNNLKIVMEFWPSGLVNMGTDPKQLLVKLKHQGFKFQTVDEKKRSLEKTDINEILKQPVGIGTNLWLEKSR